MNTPASRNFGLLFGPIAALILLVGVLGLPIMVPGYDPVRQTVSEIGEVGSPANVPFTAALLLVAASLLAFAGALRHTLKQTACSTIPAYLVGCSAVSIAGVGWFSFPHPLHNVFGPSELIGYQAPLALALALRRAPSAGRLRAFSGWMAALVSLAIVANLSIIDRHGALYTLERPCYGLVQRALFASWFLWCAGTGLWLYARTLYRV